LSSQVDKNKRFLTALFTGEFPGHAVIINAPGRDGIPGDFTVNDERVANRASRVERDYEYICSFHEAVGDDSVPFALLHTGTGVFANAFGCPIVEFEHSNPASRPIVRTPAEADALQIPDLCGTALGKHLELAAAVRGRLGDDVPVGGPDMQSPLGLAAQLWEKEAFFTAIIEAPDSVLALVHKCHAFIKGYLTELHRTVPNLNPIHCPTIWGPTELGASVSEDEVGAISRRTYEKFGLWCLTDLSETFGGLVMHCCAAADHQYAAFKTIPNLRALNKVYTASGPEPVLRGFGDRVVHMQAWQSLDLYRRLLDYDIPGVRFAFCYDAQSVDDGKRALETLRNWCPRTIS
jgi:hypothetical protein